MGIGDGSILEERISELEGMFHKQNNQLGEFSIQLGTLEKRMEEQEMHTKYGTIEQVLENIDKMKKTWDENIESFLKQVDDKLDLRDEQIADINHRLDTHWDVLDAWEKQMAELRDRMKTMEKFYSTLYDIVDNNRIRTNELKETVDMVNNRIKIFVEDPKTEKKDSELDIRPITIKGDMYWMPKAEANQLIEEFLEDMQAVQDNLFDEYTDGLTLGKVMEKWQGRVK